VASNVFILFFAVCERFEGEKWRQLDFFQVI